MSRLLSAKELACAIGVTPETIRDWARTGLIPCVRLGRIVRFRLDVVEVRLAQRQDMPSLAHSCPQERSEA